MTVDATRQWRPPSLPFAWNPPSIAGLTPQAELAAACRFLHEIGYDEPLFGHITWEQPDGAYLTNAFEVTFDCMTASDVLPVDDHGSKIDDHALNPSPGLDLHISLRHYVARELTTCVIHAHPRHGILWAVRATAPPIYDLGSAWLPDDVHIVTDERQLWLDEADATAIGSCGWGLLERHGAISLGSSLHHALYRLQILEHRSRQAWLLEGRPGITPMNPQIAQQFPTMRGASYGAKWWNAMLRRQIQLHPSILD